MRIGHLVDQMCLSNSYFFYRMFTFAAPNVSHAVFCNRRVNAELFPHPRIQTRVVSTAARDLLARRISSSLAANVQNGISMIEWRRFLRRYRPDVLHAQDGKQAVQWLSLVESTELPLVVTFHGSDINCATYNSQYLANLNLLFDRASRLHFVSQALCDRALSLGADRNKCDVVHLGTPIGKAAVYSARTENCVFGIAANLVPCKGHETLFLAFSRVLKKFPETKLYIWGDGPLKSRLQWLSLQLGIAGNVLFCGQISYDELQEFIRKKTDVVLLPSQKDDAGCEEGLPMSLCEASAIGVPCIATDCGGISELIVNNETGLLVQQRAEHELADAMLRLAGNPIERQRLGKAARQAASSSLDVTKQLQRIQSVYKRAVDGPALRLS